jgi:hypothetical protein
MLTVLLNLIVMAVLIAVVGWVFIRILTTDDHILSWYRKFINKILKDGERKPEWFFSKLHKALIGCELCFSGQLALWWYILFRHGIFNYNFKLITYDFHIDHLIILISLTIFIVFHIEQDHQNRLWKKQKEGRL